MKNTKRLLIINHDFPPAGGAGIKRCLKFMKFLPEYGWQLTVLTVRNGNHPIIDRSLLREVGPHVTVHRAFTFESLFNKGAERIKNSNETAKVTQGNQRTSLRHRLTKIYDTYGHLFKIPDSRILWMPAAVAVALKLVLKKQFDVIYATGPTFVNFIIAAFVKVLSRKPLIIDFRDAWLADPMIFDNEKRYLIKIHRILEKFVIHQADRVASTNPFVTRDFRERYRSEDPDKFITLYNGFDIDDFAFMNAYNHRDNDTFTIVYTGRLYDERTPKYFLEALKLALEENPEMRHKTRVILVGSCEPFLDGRRIEGYLEEYNLKDVVQLTGHISRSQSLEYQMSASVLLLIIGIVPPEMELTYGLSGKVFDYLLSEKPILTLANGGSTREFIVANKIGEIFYHEEVQKIRDYLIEAYTKFTNGTPAERYDVAAYEKFDFRSLSKTLSEQLESVLNDTKG